MGIYFLSYNPSFSSLKYSQIPTSDWLDKTGRIQRVFFALIEATKPVYCSDRLAILDIASTTHLYKMAAMTSTFLGSAVAAKAPVKVAAKKAVAPVASLDGLKKVRINAGNLKKPIRGADEVTAAVT